jgi:glycolate oxidase
MDFRAFSACNSYAGNIFDNKKVSSGAILLVSFEGKREEGVLEDLNRSANIVRDLTSDFPIVATDENIENNIWSVRMALAEADHLYSSVEVVGEDIVVPYAFLPAFIDKLLKIESRYQGIMITNCGHAADGNLHTTIHRMPGISDKEWHLALEKLKGEIYFEMNLIGGKLTGEHGVGSKRVKDFATLVSPQELEILREIKKAWDPYGILNPGTIF